MQTLMIETFSNIHFMLKIVLILISLGVVKNFISGTHNENIINVLNTIHFALNVKFIDNKYFYIIFIIGLVSIYALNLLHNHLLKKYSDTVLQSKEEFINLLITQNVMLENKCDKLLKANSHMKNKLVNDKNSLSFLLNRMYQEFDGNKDYGRLAELCKKLADLYEKPEIVWVDRSSDVFNQLSTKRQHKRAKRILEDFRRDNYFGDGFDRDMDYYIHLLEEVLANGPDRVKQKKRRA